MCGHMDMFTVVAIGTQNARLDFSYFLRLVSSATLILPIFLETDPLGWSKQSGTLTTIYLELFLADKTWLELVVSSTISNSKVLQLVGNYGGQI